MEKKPKDYGIKMKDLKPKKKKEEVNEGCYGTETVGAVRG